MSAKKKLSAPLLYFGRVIGLILFRVGEYQSDFQSSIIGVVYGTVLAIVYSIVFAMAMYSRFTITLPMETPLIIIGVNINIVSIYFVFIATCLTFAYRQEHIIKMLRDFLKIQEIAWEYFGIPTDYDVIIHQATVHATWTNVVFFINLMWANLLFYSEATYNFPMWISFSLPIIVHHNVIFLFLVWMTAIKWKFRQLNEKLIQHERSITSSKSINDFAYVHGLLCDHAESVNDFFSHLVLLIIIEHFIQFVTNTYLICILLKCKECTYMMLAMLYVQLMSVVICILQEYFIGSIVDDTVREARNTGNALHEMANQQRPLRQRTQVYAFSIQLLRRRLDLSAHGFFKFDLTLMRNTICGGTTYIIFMMQLENFNPNTSSN